MKIVWISIEEVRGCECVLCRRLPPVLQISWYCFCEAHLENSLDDQFYLGLDVDVDIGFGI